MITEKVFKTSPLSALFMLSWPPILSGWVQTSFDLVNAYWVSHLGDSSMGVLSVATFIIWHFFCFPFLLHPGLTQKIAFLLGQGDTESVKKIAWSGICWSFGLGILAAMLGFLLLPGILLLINLKGDLYQKVYFFMSIFFLHLPFLYAFHACLSILRGYSQTKEVAFLSVFVLLVNGLLDPLFIYYFDFQVYGAVLSSVCAILSGFMIASAILWKKKFLIRKLASRQVLWEFLRIGTPMTLSNLSFCVVYLILTRYIVLFGDAPLAAMGIAFRLEGIAYFCAVGIGMASTSAIGLSLGRKDYVRTAQFGNAAIYLTALFVLPLSLLFLGIPHHLMRLFTENSEEIRHGAYLLRTLGFVELALGIELALEGVFAGLGRTFWAGTVALFGT
ncbi:MAG: MATE family efflux transporter, partial [Planctomycetota bacterium]